jgi:hypothetical protein
MYFTGVSDGVKGLGVALGAVAVTAGSYYLFKAAEEEDEYERKHESYLQEEVMSGLSRSEQRCHQDSHEVNKLNATSQECRGFLQNDSSIIVITVDAAPGKCAGILRLPRHQTLYTYSIDWTHMFVFPKKPSKQESDKFEILNALIATLAFKKVIEIYKDSYSSILLQTDNSFASMKPGWRHRDPMIQAIFEHISAEMNLHVIPYEWNHVKKREDVDMWNANQLSLDSDEPAFSELEYKNYVERIDIGVDVLNIVLPAVKSKVPSRFHTKYNKKMYFL